MPGPEAEAIPLPEELEDKFEYLETIAKRSGIVLRRVNHYIFAHFTPETATNFINFLIRSIGAISGEAITAAEETHPTLAKKIMNELLTKSNVKQLFADLNLKLYRVYLVVSPKQAKKMPKMTRVGDIVFGYPEGIEEISSYIKEVSKEKSADTMAGKIAKAAIAYLLLKAQEYAYSGYAADEAPVILVIWFVEPQSDRIMELEKAVLKEL